MPFKIVQTLNKDKNKEELCICPSGWEKHGVLHWPSKKSKKLSKIEDSIPKPEWSIMKCTVKRKNIQTYDVANQQLQEMLECSTTEIEETSSAASSSVNKLQMYKFNDIAEQASSQSNFESSVPSFDQIYNNPICTYTASEPLSLPTVDVEQVSQQEQDVIVTADLEKIALNQIAIYKTQEDLLKNQTIIIANYTKVLENQHSMMMAIAELSVKLDTIISTKAPTTIMNLHQTMKKSTENSVFSLRPIQNLSELYQLEKILENNDSRADYKSKYSIVCQTGKAINCTYQLVDVFFNRDFLTQCSWSGSARGEGTKICLKVYKNVLNFFFELIYDCDKSYTIATNEAFFKSILKNATKRKLSKLQRSSTARLSHKRKKQDESNENDSNKENLPNEENVPMENQLPNDNEDVAPENSHMNLSMLVNLSCEDIASNPNVEINPNKIRAHEYLCLIFYKVSLI